MRINHNISAMITSGSLHKANRTVSKQIHKLSTGLRITSAADDAAGLGVSENLRTQVRGLGQAFKNTQDAIALLNIADGALNEMTDIVQRMRELVLQAKNDTYTADERSYMGQEFRHLVDEIDRIAAVTNYNGIQIFATPEQTMGRRLYSIAHAQSTDGVPRDLVRQFNIYDDPADSLYGETDWGSSHHLNFMIGGNVAQADVDAYNGEAGTGDGQRDSYDKSASNMLTIQFGQMDSNTIFSRYANAFFVGDGSNMFDGFDFDPADSEDGTLNAFFNWFESRDATVADKLDLFLQIIDGDEDIGNYSNLYGDASVQGVTGLKRITTMRAHIGAMTNRLEHVSNTLLNQQMNTQAAESTIRDADFAQETIDLTKNQILANSSTAMLAQANSIHNSVLSLLSA